MSPSGPESSSRGDQRDQQQCLCVNKGCTSNNDHLCPALPVVCRFFCVEFNPEKMVCCACLNTCLSSYKDFPINKTYLEIELEKNELEDFVTPENVPNTNTNCAVNNQQIKEVKIIDEDVIAINDIYYSLPSDLPKEEILVFPPLCEKQMLYGKMESLLEPWSVCKITLLPVADYMYVQYEDSSRRLLNRRDAAYFLENSVRFPVGCRVISRYTNINSKSNDDYYAGIVAEPPKFLNDFRYLIFFDTGHVQYCHHRDIRLIVDKSTQVWNYVHDNMKNFIQKYLEDYPERSMVKLALNQSIKTLFENKWLLAKVIEVDASLVKLSCLGQEEWLYRGSSRLWSIHEKLTKPERGIRSMQSGLACINKPFLEYSTVEEEPQDVQEPQDIQEIQDIQAPQESLVCSSPKIKRVAHRSTTSENSAIATKRKKTSNDVNYATILPELPESCMVPKEYVSHVCSPSCVEWTGYDYSKTKGISVLSIPLHFGYQRLVANFNKTEKFVFYNTPCGCCVRNMKEMYDFLTLTNNKMTIDLFDFNILIRPRAEYNIYNIIKSMEDISMGKEFRKLTCVNSLNEKLPTPMQYLTARQPMPGVNINVDRNFLCGCDCTDNCLDKSKCACWKLTIEGQNIIPSIYKDSTQTEIGYQYRRLQHRVLTGIYECNSTCKCSKTCLNRVVQNPLSQNLQLFMTVKKGWGIRCLNDIPLGSFICVFVGCLLTETDANEGGMNYGDEYMAELDFIEVAERIKKDYESEVADSEQEDSNSSVSGIYSELSDKNFQITSSGDAMRVVSDFPFKLRKHKTPNKSNILKKKKKQKKSPSEFNVRNVDINQNASKSIREYFGKNESVYIMDAKTSGNIGRYLNHSCNPNVFVQNVFVDTHDVRFPWICFFARHDILAGTELTWDYSYVEGSVPGKVMKCLCESPKCRGRLL